MVAGTTLAGCSGDIDDEGVADEAALTSGVSGELAVGTELTTTARVNFRTGPSTSTAVKRILAKGSTVVTVNRTRPSGAFYNVKSGNDEGWVHGGYLAKAGSGATEPTPTPTPTPGGTCAPRKLRFSADELPSLPAAGSAYVWGANATGGASAPYSSEFISYAAQAHQRGLQVFAYLEGPCGDTGGVDDGERARCSGIHRSFNAQNAPGTPNTDKARWKPFTMHQLKRSAQVGADYCEIDNLSNNVTIPLNPLLREIKALYDSGQVHCRFVLKNVEAADIDSIRTEVAPTPAAANFIAPFHIFEADDTGQKGQLDAAMVRLKGPGAKTIISTDTNHYGGAFTPDQFLACN